MINAVVDHSFAVSEGDAVVRLDKRFLWTGRVLDVDALDAFGLPGTSHGIVLLDQMDRPQGVESWHR